MEFRPLGRSGLTVSCCALGSWRTFERISAEAGIAVMHAARESGITFLDDARYDDETGMAPMRTGYSEVVFGELFRAAGWDRDTTLVSNKLWWEFWPEQHPRQELDGSLERMGLDYLDLIYTDRPPPDLPLEEFIGMVTELIAEGKARAWGVLNWPAPLVAAAGAVTANAGLPSMAANQVAYSLVDRALLDGGAGAALESAGASAVASFSLAGGVLSGKYLSPGATGREAAALDSPKAAASVSAARELAVLAEELGTEPATLAIAFALDHPAVASVLFGATRPEQVRANVAAVELLAGLDDATRERLAAIGRTGTDGQG